MPSDSRLLSFLIVFVCFSAVSCGKQLAALSDLSQLHSALVEQYGETGVNVNLESGNILSVTFINSRLNDQAPGQRASRAQETAVFVKQHYSSVASLDEIWVGFMRQKTRFLVVTYTEPLEYFTFDREAHPLEKTEPGVDMDYEPVRPTVVYSPVRDETDISISRLQLEGNLENGIALAPHFIVAGDATSGKLSKPPEFVGLDFASYSDISMFPGETQIIFKADGKTVFETKSSFSTSKSGDKFSEFLLLQVPYGVFRKMVGSESITLIIGDREFRLTAAQVQGLRAMTEYVRVEHPRL
jgi:hypothetical protein